MNIKEIRVGDRLRITKEVEPEIEDTCDVVFENNEVTVVSVHDNGDIQAWVNLVGEDNQVFDFSIEELEPISENTKKSEKIAEEVWNMLPDECKEIMKGVESSFKASVSADIEAEYAPYNDTNTNR